MTNIKKNFFYQSFYEIFIIVMPLITSPYISRVLGAEAIGIYSYTYSMAYYFVLFAMLGINNYGNRLISTVRDDKPSLNKEFSSLLCAHLTIAISVLIVYLIYCFFIVDVDERIYAFIQSLFVISAVFDINWFFFGLEEFKLSVTRNTIVKVLSFISIFLIVKQKNDLYIYCLIMAIGILLSQISVWPFLKKRITFVRFEKKDYYKHFKPLSILFIPVLAVSVYKIMDKVMLGYISSRISLGYYENAEKIISVFVTAIASFGTVMMPRMNNLFSKGDSEMGNYYLEKSMKWILIVTYAVTFGIIAVSPEFVVFFWGKEFVECSPILSTLAISLPFVAFASVIRMQYLIPKHMDKEYIVSVIGGAIINFAINVALIPRYSGIGAAIGTICAEAFVCIYQMWCVRKDIKVFNSVYNSLPFLLLGTLMLLSVRLIAYNIKSQLLIKLFLEIVAGSGIYLSITVFLLRKDIKSYFVNK